ncbi:hypothetical protein [Sphingomonas colocasiae]|uniref:Uncharacterized protein n=1 Tax=Sphingomonas colocasiae TaxID=1848973 RepID=A0ABS7PKX0_9SPHN|nr:hypothetical protein [Sphingomonas colocasiae]MBY8821385.1 hypothetical protein [Sphingomonas colocasiae]
MRIPTTRNVVITEAPEPDDVFVYVGWSGPTDGPQVRHTMSTRYMPITEYQACVDWAVSMADQMSHPLYVVPLNRRDVLLTGRFHPIRAAIQRMTDQERSEMRRIVVTTCCEVMRDCDDPEIRADMFDVLRKLKVTYES